MTTVLHLLIKMQRLLLWPKVSFMLTVFSLQVDLTIKLWPCLQH